MTGRHVPLAPDPRSRPHVGAPERSRGEGRRLLLALLGAPAAWTVHLAASYIVIALWCANGWAGGRLALLGITLLAVVAATAAGILSWRLWRRGQERLLADDEPGVPESWDSRMGERGASVAFLAVLALFMSATFGYLIVLEGLPSLFAPLCHASTIP